MNLNISGSEGYCWIDINSLKLYVVYTRTRSPSRFSVRDAG